MTKQKAERLSRNVFPVNGLSLAYARAGKRWPLWRDRLVLVHGTGCSADSWRYQVDGLSPYLGVVAVDLPGHGGTKPVPDPSIRRYASMVEGLIEHIGTRKVFLGGHSMGGAVALQVALERPELLKGVILVATTAYLDTLALTPDILLWAGAAVPGKFRELFFSRSVTEEALAIARGDVRRCSLETVLSDFATCRQFDLRSKLKGMSVPTLILCGKEDRITSARHSKQLHRQIQGSSLMLIPKAGHMLPLEAPVQVNAAIRDFIRKR
jgi:pimeloyl-ACP methyl ester carboxylesterase